MENFINTIRGKSLLIVLTIILILQMMGFINIGLVFPFIVGKEAGILAVVVFMLTSSLAKFDLSGFASKETVKTLESEIHTLKIEAAVCKVERDTLREEFIKLAKLQGLIDQELRILKIHAQKMSEDLSKKETELAILTRHK